MKKELYKEIKPCKELENFIDSYWMHKNPSINTQINTISASSFVNLVFFERNKEITFYVLAGVWTTPKEILLQPSTTVYGCRMKILAPEYLLQTETASICDQMKSLELSFLQLENFRLDNFKEIINQWEEQLLRIKSPKLIPEHKLKLSELLYSKKGNISTREVYEEIYWSNRQINRYLNKNIGIPLKKYLSILKIHDAFVEIIEGDLYPNKGYFDQSHFIREVKKYAGTTPKNILRNENDCFIQLRNITRK